MRHRADGQKKVIKGKVPHYLRSSTFWSTKHTKKMTIPTSTRAVVLERYAEVGTDPSSLVTYFAIKELPVPNPLPEDSLLVKTLYLSNDPAQRLWMQKPGPHSGERSDLAELPLGTPFDTFLLARVVQVGGEGGPIKVGDVVEARGKWADYCMIKKAGARLRR